MLNASARAEALKQKLRHAGSATMHLNFLILKIAQLTVQLARLLQH